MTQENQTKRTRAHLLVAAIGVATVSYVGASGCAPDTDADEAEHEEATSEPSEETSDGQLGSTREGLSVSPALETTALQRITIPLPTGNLVPPPPYEVDLGSVVVKNPFPPSGNLMAPPVLVRPTKIVLPPPSGNLMAPPIQEFEVDLALEQEIAR